jgi:endonuclease/exonuclease/phosphatase family metal-dependent hydrolase
MKKLILLLGITCLVLFAGCSNRNGGKIIKVMTLNLRYDNPRDSLNAWPYRASLVARFLKEEQPDLLGMQEVLSNQFDYLDSVLKEDYADVGIGRTDGAKKGEMNPVFYRKERFDMIRTITFWLSTTPDVPGSISWGSSLPRIVTWIELVGKEDHQRFYFFNTHFAHDSDSARILSSKFLLHAVDSITDGLPFIITGDLNMLPTSTGYSILTGPYENVPLMKDSFIISEKRPYGPQFTFNGFSEKSGQGRIDYIFVRNGMGVTDQRTIVKKEKGVYISDHWPVMASVSMK